MQSTWTISVFIIMLQKFPLCFIFERDRRFLYLNVTGRMVEVEDQAWVVYRLTVFHS